MPHPLPAWIDPSPWLPYAAGATSGHVQAALHSSAPGVGDLAALLSPAARPMLEAMARRARDITRRRFGNTIDLYIPLYLSNECNSGCAYCGFAADRSTPRRTMAMEEVDRELDAIAAMGLEEILLLTGERSPTVSLSYLEACVEHAARRFHRVTIETFPMDEPEYRAVASSGCTGVTLYQETYHPAQFRTLHRWGSKRDFHARLEAPVRALAAGIRTVGLGALLGLHDPVYDMLALYLHTRHLQREFWQAGIALSFPRVCPEAGGFQPIVAVDEAMLAQIVFAFRIVFPDVPLVLSTRERPMVRDAIAGVGITRMSVASRTTVGGYAQAGAARDGQFHVHDDRDVATFCASLRALGLAPVFKNWEAVYR